MNNFSKIPSPCQKLPRKGKKKFTLKYGNGLYSYCRLRNTLEADFSDRCKGAVDAFVQLQSYCQTPEEKNLLAHIDFTNVAEMMRSLKNKMSNKLQQSMPSIDGTCQPNSNLSMTITINDTQWQKK